MKRLDFKDVESVRNHINNTIGAVLQDALKTPLHVKIISSVVTHDGLQPDGDLFYISIRVETHPRQEEPKKE